MDKADKAKIYQFDVCDTFFRVETKIENLEGIR